MLLTACPNEQSAREPRDRNPDPEFAVAAGAPPAQNELSGLTVAEARPETLPSLNDFSPLPAPVSVAHEMLGETPRPVQLAQANPPVRAPVTVLRTQTTPAQAAVMAAEPGVTAPPRTTSITLRSTPVPPDPVPEPVIAAQPVTPPAAVETPIATPPIVASPAPRPVDNDAAPAITAAAAPDAEPAIEPIQATPGRSLADIADNSSGWRVQIASLSSQDAAEGEWTRLQALYLELLGEQTLRVERADLSKGIFYRVQTGPLGERAAVVQLCEQLQAQGQDCFVTGGQTEAGAADGNPRAAAR